MKTPSRLTSTDNSVVSLNKYGQTIYHYDIKPIKIKDKDFYSYIEVIIDGYPTYEKKVKSIIRTYLSVDEEFDIINSYNKYNLGIDTNSKAKEDYIEYLNLLNTIKQNIKNE